MATKTKSRYQVGVYCFGQRQWRSESVYDRMTTAPKIVAIAADEATAEAWIDQQMARQEAERPILPGQGWHELYATIDLNAPQAYLSRQDAGRNPCCVHKCKAALVADPSIVKL